MITHKKVVLFALLVIFSLSGSVLAQKPDGLMKRNGNSAFESREKARLNRAAAHYQRARSHLLRAIDEFNKASKLANPSLVMDSNSWLNSVADNAKKLNKVLAPQPANSTYGVKLEAAPKLLKTR